MSLVTVEVTWLQWLLEDFVVSVSVPTPLLCDSTGAISIAHDPIKHELTKHVGVDAHFTRSQVQDGVFALQCVPRASVGLFHHEVSDSRSSSVLPLQTQCC
jgi:hypothetical protein